MRLLSATLLLLLLKWCSPQDDCADDTDWSSDFGTCETYARNWSTTNFGFCGEDRGGENNALAADACPLACERCTLDDSSSSSQSDEDDDSGGQENELEEEICNLVIAGREGVNAVINGPYQQIGVKDDRPFYIHTHTSNVYVYFLQLSDANDGIFFEGWVISGTLWTTEVYAFVQDQSDHPDDISEAWTIWDGDAGGWTTDSKIKALCGCIHPLTGDVDNDVLCGSTLCDGSCLFDANAECEINTCGGCFEIWSDFEGNPLVCETGQCDIRIGGREGFNDVINGVYELVEGQRHLGRPYYVNPVNDFYLFFTDINWWIISDEFDGETYYALNMNDAITPENLQDFWNVFTGDSTAEDQDVYAQCGGTCYDRCGGMNAKFGCSCEESCLEDDTCCEDFNTFCAVIEGCADIQQSWVDTEGFVCSDYSTNEWCGAEENEIYSTGGLSADQNCCVCGGGIQDDVPGQQDGGDGGDCEDLNWLDLDGTGCETYVQFDWCGDDYNQQVAVDGISADEACCGCGGGGPPGAGGSPGVGNDNDTPSVDSGNGSDESGCSDAVGWLSQFGDCESYGSGGGNFGFCSDTGEGGDSRPATDACPVACGTC